MKFEFTTSARILFGEGSVAEVIPSAHAFGKCAFVTLDSLERSDFLLQKLRDAGIAVFPFPVKDEPDIASISLAIRKAREFGCDLVIGMGGGSTLDTGKTVAAFLTNPGELFDYLEVIGKGQALTISSRPFIAIPTTAGTGSEVTRNAVIGVPDRRLKVSIRSQVLLPRLAIVDPELTCSLPPQPTAQTGMDALTQLIEPLVSNAATPLTDSFCREGIPRVARSLLAAYKNGENMEARADMSLASLLGGLALANAKLGAVHGLANPIGGMSHAPHGAVCARLLPLVLEANLKALQARRPDSPTLSRYTEVARLLTGDPSARAEDSLTWIQDLVAALDIRPLGEYGLNAQDFDRLVEQGQKASSMKGNPVPLSDEELLSILKEAV